MGTKKNWCQPFLSKMVPAPSQAPSAMTGDSQAGMTNCWPQFLAFLVTQSWVTTHSSSHSVAENSRLLV